MGQQRLRRQVSSDWGTLATTMEHTSVLQRFVRTLALGLVLALLPSAGFAQGLASLRQPLTTQERARLDRNEIIVRPARERRGSLALIGGTSFQVVNLTPEQAWRALQDDAGHMRRMLPQVAEARQIQQTGNRRLMRFTHRVGPVSAGYSMFFDYDHTNKAMVFRLDDSRPRDLRAAWGYLRVRRWHDGRTLISFGCMVDVGQGFVTGLMRNAVHEWVLKIPLTFKRYVEGDGRRRYRV